MAILLQINIMMVNLVIRANSQLLQKIYRTYQVLFIGKHAKTLTLIL